MRKLCRVPAFRSMSALFNHTKHRPWPLPSAPWIMAQSWHDLLFAHWPVDAAMLRSHIPADLAIDTFDGQAWLGIIPFSMTGVRLRWTPPVPGLSAFPELNVRTYVTGQGKPGVWFFSLDAASALAVAAARLSFHLPYFRARMQCTQADGWIKYESHRTHRGAPSAILEGKYRPTGEPIEAKSITHHGSCKQPKRTSRETQCPKLRAWPFPLSLRFCISREGKTWWRGRPIESNKRAHHLWNTKNTAR